MSGGLPTIAEMDLKFDKMCRICMCENQQMLPLFSPNVGAPNFPEQIMAISKVRILESDGLPHQLCAQCATRLDAAITFKNLCEKSDTAYQEYMIEKVKISMLNPNNIIKEELAFDVRYDPTNAINNDDFDEFLIFKAEPDVNLKEDKSNFKMDTDDNLLDHSEKSPGKALKKKGASHNGKYCCKYCGVDAQNSTLLNKHYRSFHDGNKSDVSNTDDSFDADRSLISSNSTDGLGIVNMDASGAIATIKEEIIQNQSHLVLEVSYRCSICDVQYDNQQSYAAHMTKHSGRLPKETTEFKCNVCEKTFNKRKNLKQHILTHNKEKMNKCTLCHRSFTRPDQLILHMNTHTGKKRHQCAHCDKGFNMLSTLRDHLRTHSGEKPFLCSICGKGFTQNTNLKQHLMRHSATKPFDCVTCKAKFVSKGELDAHIRKHTGDHPFVCDTCGTGFTTSSSLVKHKRIHTGEKPYACDLCSLRFTALGTLKNHRRTHTGEKPFICSHCPRAFAQKSDLVSHVRTHTGERPYVCTTCCSPFHQLSALKSHIRAYHPIVKPEEAIMILKMSPENSNSNIIDQEMCGE